MPFSCQFLHKIAKYLKTINSLSPLKTPGNRSTLVSFTKQSPLVKILLPCQCNTLPKPAHHQIFPVLYSNEDPLKQEQILLRQQQFRDIILSLLYKSNSFIYCIANGNTTRQIRRKCRVIIFCLFNDHKILICHITNLNGFLNPLVLDVVFGTFFNITIHSMIWYYNNSHFKCIFIGHVTSFLPVKFPSILFN